MQAHQKDRHSAGADGKAADDVADSFDGDRLQVLVIQIVLFQKDTGKTVVSSHFRSCQDYAAHAVVRADIDLMTLRHQHADVHNVPCAVYRSIEFKSVAKWNRKRGIRDLYGRICFFNPGIRFNSAKHDLSSEMKGL